MFIGYSYIFLCVKHLFKSFTLFKLGCLSLYYGFVSVPYTSWIHLCQKYILKMFFLNLWLDFPFNFSVLKRAEYFNFDEITFINFISCSWCFLCPKDLCLSQGYEDFLPFFLEVLQFWH